MKADYHSLKKSFGLVCVSEPNNPITNTFVLVPC